MSLELEHMDVEAFVPVTLIFFVLRANSEMRAQYWNQGAYKGPGTAAMI